MEVEYQTLDPLRSNYKTLHHYKPHHYTPPPSFEFKVIYFRFVTSLDILQTSVTLDFPPRDPHTRLQINGDEADPGEPAIRCLNKHREDIVLSESVFVNTDRIKFRGKYVSFEVSIKGCPVVKGVVMRRKEEEGGEWVLECREGEGAMAGGLVDVYCAGNSLGKVVLLNQVVEFKGMKQMVCFQPKGGSPKGLKFTEELGHKSYDDQFNLSHSVEDDEEEKQEMLVEEGELSWFSAGMKLGIGLGVGMSLGFGVSAGLAIRTYKTTARVLSKLM